MDHGPGPPTRDDQGFTLIELMVVVLIIAILIAVAIPSFLGARQTANDRATQANVRSAFVAARVYYTDHQQYSDDPATMGSVEPSLGWTTTQLDGSSPDRSIYIKVYDVPDPKQTVVVVGRTKTGHCFYLRDVMGGATAGTYYQHDVTGASTCPDIDPSTIANTSWEG